MGTNFGATLRTSCQDLFDTMLLLCQRTKLIRSSYVERENEWISKLTFNYTFTFFVLQVHFLLLWTDYAATAFSYSPTR